MITQRAPLSSARIAAVCASSSSGAGPSGASSAAMTPPSSQPMSAGATSDAMRPGRPLATRSASIASAAKLPASRPMRTQSEKGAQAPTTSADSGASYC